jgi:hypothetical protein
MATVNKNFRIKQGLVVEGSTGTINGQNILTETGSDQYILDLIGGETLVKSVSNQFDVSAGGELSIDRAVVDTYYDAAGSAATAQSNAEDYADGLASNYDAAGSAATAQSNAEDYADGLASNYDAAGSAAAAQTAAESYADGLASNYDAAGSASTAETNAKDYADNLIGDATVDGTPGNTVTNRIATAVANLVDSAPEALDTLNELAAALGDNVDGMTGIATAIGNKLPLAGGTMSGNIEMGTNKVTGLGAPSSDSDAATKEYVDDAQGAAEDYADGLASNYDAAGSAAAAQTAAESYADGLTNDMLDGSTPFTDLNINDVAKQVAARTTSLSSVVVTAYQFNRTNFKSGKFLVKIDNGTHNEISEILVTLDSSNNVAITEYAIVGTNGSRGTITADVDGTHCRIRVNPVDNSTITVSGTVFNA